MSVLPPPILVDCCYCFFSALCFCLSVVYVWCGDIAPVLDCMVREWSHYVFIVVFVAANWMLWLLLFSMLGFWSLGFVLLAGRGRGSVGLGSCIISGMSDGRVVCDQHCSLVKQQVSLGRQGLLTLDVAAESIHTCCDSVSPLLSLISHSNGADINNSIFPYPLSVVCSGLRNIIIILGKRGKFSSFELLKLKF